MRRLTPSTTTKSFPTPCILVNFNFIEKRFPLAAGASIPLRFAGGPRLEALVRPEILLGHFAHALLDEGVHAAGVGGIVAAREIFPDRMAGELVSRAAG